MFASKRKAQAEVLGAIFFVVLAVVVFALFTELVSAQYYLAQQATQAQLIAGNKAHESLSVCLQSKNSQCVNNEQNGCVYVKNNGPQTAVITYYTYYINQNQKVQKLTPPVSIAPGPSPQPTPICVPPPTSRVGVITSYGNIWWNSTKG